MILLFSVVALVRYCNDVQMNDRRRLSLASPKCGGPSISTEPWWAPQPYDNSSLLYFTHIAHTGGTGLSWHLMGIPDRNGGLQNYWLGSFASAGMEPGLISAKAKDEKVVEQWKSGARSEDGITPAYPVAFGHNSPNDRRLADYGGKIQLLTLLREPSEIRLHNAVLWLCGVLAKEYAPWWQNDTDVPGDFFKSPSVSGSPWARPPAPVPVTHYCRAKKLISLRQATALRPFPGIPVNAEPASSMTNQLTRPLSNARSIGPTEPPCTSARGAEGAFKNLADMPWFGILEHWAGSVCLLHYVTRFPWPHEDQRACGSSVAGVSHFGGSPNKGNGFSTCPVLTGEKLLGQATNKVFTSWLMENHPDLYPHIYEGEVRPKPLSVQAGSPFHGFNMTSGASVDASLYAWGKAVFEKRMVAASRDLAKQGVSISNVPPFLSPDCFARPAPGGFAWGE